MTTTETAEKCLERLLVAHLTAAGGDCGRRLDQVLLFSWPLRAVAVA